MNKLASPNTSRSMAIAASAAAFASPNIAEAQEPVAPQAPTPVLTEFDVERCQNVMLGSGVFSLELKGKVGSRVIKLTSEFDAPAPISYAGGTQTVDCTKITLTKYEVQPVQRATKKVKTSSGTKSKNRISDIGSVSSLIADSAKGYNPGSDDAVTKSKNIRLPNKHKLTKARAKKRTFGYRPVITSIPRLEAIRALNPNINVAALKERTKKNAIKWVGSKAIQKTGSGSQDPNKVIYPSRPPQPLDQAGQEAMLRKCNLMVGLNADAPGGKQDGNTKYMQAQVELDTSGEKKHNYTFRTYNGTEWCGGVLITKAGVQMSFEPDSRNAQGGSIKDKAGSTSPDGYEQVVFLGKNDKLPYSGLLSSAAHFRTEQGSILSWRAQ